MKDIIKNFCEKAMEGSLGFDEFYNQWPKQANSVNFFHSIYEDIEDAIQHYPIKLISGEPNIELWYKSDTYLKLYLDASLLKLNESNEKLETTRARIIKEKFFNLSKQIIDNTISGYMQY